MEPLDRYGKIKVHYRATLARSRMDLRQSELSLYWEGFIPQTWRCEGLVEGANRTAAHRPPRPCSQRPASRLKLLHRELNLSIIVPPNLSAAFCPMPAALDLLHRQIEFQSAIDHQSNILKKLNNVQETRDVYAYLFERTSDIRALTAHHLGVDRAQCVVSHWEEWIRGSFNVCIPVRVEGQYGETDKTVLMRCPMAYALGKDTGIVDEKIGCEVATYAWMQDNCPEVNIPDLLGFGFSDGRKVSSAKH